MRKPQGDLTKIISFLTKHPEHIQKVNRYCEKLAKGKHTYTKEKALALYTSLNLSKYKYIALRKSAEEGHIIYPSYYQLQQAKRECYPPPNSIMVTDIFARITLQSLLDHTSRRILDSLQVSVTDQLLLIGKIGFDGASGQSLYKQKFENTDSDDQSVFMIAYVPLKLCMLNDQTNVIWENPRPSSTIYCRPVSFQFIKESRDIIQNAWQSLEDAISLLNLTEIDTNTSIKHTVLVTMIDGKICSTIAGSKSSMQCYICGAKPVEMNKLDVLAKKSITTKYYNFGISSLHGWIRMMECLLHISYNLDFQKWSARTEEEKQMKLRKKKLVHDRFKEELGLNIDVVKQGVGTSNDGNTARRFFKDAEISADITGIDVNLIKRFKTILIALSSGQHIDVEAFRLYCKETAVLHVNLYKWYYMPASTHKILLHGAEIIANSILPIGKLSEEALEARNKDFRTFREDHSRKVSRKFTNQDILNNLLISSDPVISSLRDIPHKNSEDLSQEARSLLY